MIVAVNLTTSTGVARRHHLNHPIVERVLCKSFVFTRSTFQSHCVIKANYTEILVAGNLIPPALKSNSMLELTRAETFQTCTCIACCSATKLNSWVLEQNSTTETSCSDLYCSSMRYTNSADTALGRRVGLGHIWLPPGQFSRD